MRLLVFTAIYPTPERPEFGSFVHAQVRALKAAGVDVDVLVLSGPSRRLINRKLIYPQGIAKLRRRLAADPPDLVHAHYSYVGAVARTQWRVPIVLTYHGDDILGTPDSEGRYSRSSRVLAAGGSLLGEFVDAVIVQNREMAERFRRGDVHVIPHEVDQRLFAPVDRAEARAQLGLDAERPYVLFAASPDVPRKNFPLAQAALQIVRRSRPETEMVIVHSESQARLALYMSACDVLAFPSRQEGSPNIIKQAMSCNLPIVSTAVGDIPELIGATDGCHIAEPDAERFATLILSELALARRTDGRPAMGHLTPERVAARVIDVYEQTLRGRSRGLTSLRERATS